MVDNNDDLNLGKDVADKETKGKGGMNKILMIVVLLVVLAGGGVAAFMLLGKDEPAASATPGNTAQTQVEVEEEEDRAAIYLSLDPAFVVNFQHNGSTRYLQLNLQVMSYDQAVIDKVEHNMPAVRNGLILLFSAQDFDELSTVEGKEQLRLDVLDSIQKVVRLKNGQKLNDAFFTGFVMQ